MDSQDKQWNKIEKLFGMISEEYAKPEEIVAIFERVVQKIKETQEEIEQKLAQNKGEMTEEMMKLQKDMMENYSVLEGIVSKIGDKMSNECKAVMAQCMEKINGVEASMPAPADFTEIEQKVADLEAKIPKIPEEISPYQVRDKLESIDNESEKQSIDSIGYLRKELDEIKKGLKSAGGRPIFGGGFSVSALNFHMIDDESLAGTKNGVNTAFTIVNVPSPTSSLKVYRNGQRVRITEDYTFSGHTITFIVPPESTEILLAHYRT